MRRANFYNLRNNRGTRICCVSSMADGAGACDVYPEDEGGDFGGGREGDVRAEPKPSRYLTFQDMMLVGFKGGGKTSWLIKFLMWWTTAFCLSLFYDEVIIICTDAGPGYKTKYSNSYYWCLFRWLYRIERRNGFVIRQMVFSESTPR